MEFINPRISGSAYVSGTLLVNNGITGSLLGTASYSDRSLTSSITYTASLSYTSSLAYTASVSITSSWAAVAATIINQNTIAFPYSGSAYITGSLKIADSGDPTFFLISSASMDMFKINDQGVVQLATMSYTPTAVPGGMYFDNVGNFYVGL